MYHIVYLTTNIINGKIYVGVHSTENLSDDYLGSGHGIKNAINKYGKHNFIREVLHYCSTDAEAYKIEKDIVDFAFVKRSDTYNQVTGGQASSMGRKYCDDSKQRMSQSQAAQIRKPHSEETKEKMRQANHNKTDAQKAEIAAKISAALKGIKRPPEQSNRLSELHKGKVITQLHRQQISAALTGIKRPGSSEEISRRQRKTYTLMIEHTNETIQIVDIQKWCASQGLSFCMINLTFKKNQFYKGYKITAKSGGTHNI